ncbi:MAG: hypothetical protein KC456_05495 [Flavobacteriales bacterium]|jgi:hypothetical protein|nr:hypothetical protein [Flavobacteriales bacterium]
MNRLTFVLTISVSILLISCKSEVEFTDPQLPLEAFYQGYQKQPEVVEFENSESIEFTSNGGYIVNIPKHAFTLSDGRSFSGTVTLEYTELLNKSEMVLSDKHTLDSENKPMISAGEFGIKATSEQGTLQIAEGMEITILSPQIEEQDYLKKMQAYDLVNDEWSISLDNSLDINSVDTTVIDSTLFMSFFGRIRNLPSTPAISWVNWDVPIVDDYVTVNFEISNPSKQNSSSILVRELNTVIKLSDMDSNGFVSYQYCPRNVDCNYLIWGYNGSYLMASLTSFKASTDQTIELNPMYSISEKELVELIESAY